MTSREGRQVIKTTPASSSFPLVRRLPSPPLERVGRERERGKLAKNFSGRAIFQLASEARLSGGENGRWQPAMLVFSRCCLTPRGCVGGSVKWRRWEEEEGWPCLPRRVYTVSCPNSVDNQFRLPVTRTHAFVLREDTGEEGGRIVEIFIFQSCLAEGQV